MQQLVGGSAAFKEQVERAARIASCDARVLITGETGTGKELFAQAIHYSSARASRPCVAVNCGAIPSELAESELFGHVRGAYTSAHQTRRGLVAEAEGGTLFLDDVDCLSLSTQAALLRLLQEGEFRAVGSNQLQRCDIRVIAASNRKLLEAARRGEFRIDLYYRLSVLRLALPTLQERRDDIVPLALHFVRRFSNPSSGQSKGLGADAVRKLMAHDWPGNVRELQHVIERAVLMATGPTISASDIDIDVECTESSRHKALVDSFQAAKAMMIERFERDYIEQLLVNSGGNVTHAAFAAKKNRRAFFALMRKYDIDANRFRGFSSASPG